MARIAQNALFVWSDYKNTEDLERLNLVLDTIPDEPLMRKLENQRGKSGVDKYPIRAVWNSLIAGVVYEHDTIESLRRELKRNPALRETCGFNAFAGSSAVPSSGSYSRFMSRLQDHQDDVRQIFQSLISICFENLDGFGENLGIDGKALSSFAKKKGNIPGDRRGDHDARWGKHTHRSEGSDGKIHEKSKSWFGYTLHLIADTRYELPVAFTVLPAPIGEIPVAHKLVDQMAEKNPRILKACQYLSGDRGYDDTKLHTKLWDIHQIKPIIDIRRSWQDGEDTRAFKDSDGVVYGNKGNVFCISPHYADQKTMAFRGFEKDRETLKYTCPAEHYGIECRDKQHCKISKTTRIPLSENRRIFSPVARSSYKWKKLYNDRTAVERVNSRIDKMFGFENHTIRGLKKMSFRITFSFIIMLSFAVGMAARNRDSEIRRFLSA